MLFVFSPIFVVDTKITFVYNFVAPLTSINKNFKTKKLGWQFLSDMFIVK